MQLWAKYRRLIIGLIVLFAIIWITRKLELPACNDIQAQIAAWGVLAPFVFGALYVLATIAFVPGTILTLMAGLAFGAWWGTLIVSISATLGAVCAFLVARYVAKDAVTRILTDKLWFQRFRSELANNAFNYVLFVRLVPIFPFNGINYACGLVPMKLKDYALASYLGMLPGTFAYVYLGETGCKLIEPIVQGNMRFTELPAEVRNSLLISILLLSSLAVLPLILNKIKKKPAAK